MASMYHMLFRSPSRHRVTRRFLCATVAGVAFRICHRHLILSGLWYILVIAVVCLKMPPSDPHFEACDHPDILHREKHTSQISDRHTKRVVSRRKHLTPMTSLQTQDISTAHASDSPSLHATIPATTSRVLGKPIPKAMIPCSKLSNASGAMSLRRKARAMSLRRSSSSPCMSAIRRMSRARNVIVVFVVSSAGGWGCVDGEVGCECGDVEVCGVVWLSIGAVWSMF